MQQESMPAGDVDLSWAHDNDILFEVELRGLYPNVYWKDLESLAMCVRGNNWAAAQKMITRLAREHLGMIV